jgi:hypothetical protein
VLELDFILRVVLVDVFRVIDLFWFGGDCVDVGGEGVLFV